jgi:adenosine deaminase
MTNFTFPKVELHLHIDCSLSFNFVSKVLPGISREEYERVYNTPVDCCSLNDYLACAKAAIALMQTREQIFDATLDVIHQLELDHVIYGELRFAPLQHLEKGLTPEEVVEASIDAVKSYQGPVKVNLILCTLRHFTREQSDLTADLVIKYHQQGVVSLDLAADEAGFSLVNHATAFEKVRQHKIPCTAHAGEARGSESVLETLNVLKTQRIGHGIRSVEDEALLERLKRDQIHLEICPTSNHITQVYPKGENYPIEKLKEAKVSFGINTDGRAISNVTLADEYAWLVQNKAWTIDDMFQANVDALNAAFINDDERTLLMDKLSSGFFKQLPTL